MMCLLKLAMIKVEMAVISASGPSPLRVYVASRSGLVTSMTTADIINRTALSLNLSQHSMDYPNVQRVTKNCCYSYYYHLSSILLQVNDSDM